MDTAVLQRLAVPGVSLLIAFLAFTSQYLFHYIEPGPLRKGDTYIFNALIAFLFVCYYRTCFTDPGRIPKEWQERARSGDDVPAQRQRWCRRCEIFKPPRAHHCKTCKRCVTKMDHHCVWTANCISHITLPHFVRFLAYAVVSLIYLEVLLYTRCAILWQKRDLPSYLGPSIPQLAHLFILAVVNSFILFALSLLLGRTLWSLALNITTIEGWEVERHETLLRRARVLGGYLEGPDGKRVKIEHQEFPWDIGIWSNICQGMGTWNPLLWGSPFAKSPSIEAGLSFEHNGIDDPSKPWPPPDPDRMIRASRTKPFPASNTPTLSLDKDAFAARQNADFARYEDVDGEYVIRRRPFHERLQRTQGPSGPEVPVDEAETAYQGGESSDDDDGEDGDGVIDRANARSTADGEEAWRNAEGERLADFGVDEVAEFYDEDDNVPLAELIRRRKDETRGRQL